MKTVSYRFLLILFSLLLFSGCAGVISDPVAKQVNQRASLEAVKVQPTNFEGDMILWTGQIVSTENLKEGTRIEIVQKPAAFNRRPRVSDATEGRFLALADEYLDPTIYERGREVSVAGRLDGQKTLPLGETEYTYPLVRVQELHLWPVRPPRVYVRSDYWHPYGFSRFRLNRHFRYCCY